MLLIVAKRKKAIIKAKKESKAIEIGNKLSKKLLKYQQNYKKIKFQSCCS